MKIYNIGEEVFVKGTIVGVEKTNDEKDLVYTVKVDTTNRWNHEDEERIIIASEDLFVKKN